MKNIKSPQIGIAIIGCGTRATWVVYELIKAAMGKIRLLGVST